MTDRDGYGDRRHREVWPPPERRCDQGKHDAFLNAIDKSAILETVRTGASGIGRGERLLKV